MKRVIHKFGSSSFVDPSTYYTACGMSRKNDSAWFRFEYRHVTCPKCLKTKPRKETKK